MRHVKQTSAMLSELLPSPCTMARSSVARFAGVSAIIAGIYRGTEVGKVSVLAYVTGASIVMTLAVCCNDGCLRPLTRDM